MDTREDYLDKPTSVTEPIGSKPDLPSPRRFRVSPKVAIAVAVGVVLVGAIVALLFVRAQDAATWKTAQDAYDKADYGKAAQTLKTAALPTEPTRLKVYAESMLATRQLDKALAGYKKLYEAKKDPDVQLKIGNIYNEQKKYDDAEKAYRSVMTSSPTMLQSYINLATMQKLQGKVTDAVATAKKGLEANPNAIMLYELVVALTIDNKDSSDYKASVAKLKQLDPNNTLLQSIAKQ